MQYAHFQRTNVHAVTHYPGPVDTARRSPGTGTRTPALLLPRRQLHPLRGLTLAGRVRALATVLQIATTPLKSPERC